MYPSNSVEAHARQRSPLFRAIAPVFVLCSPESSTSYLGYDDVPPL